MKIEFLGSSFYKLTEEDNTFETVTLEFGPALVEDGEGGGSNVFGEINVIQFLSVEYSDSKLEYDHNLEDLYGFFSIRMTSAKKYGSIEGLKL